MHEWENDGRGVVGSDLSWMFEGEQDTISEEINVGGKVFRIKSNSRENRHVNSRTGTMLWEGSMFLSRFIAASCDLFHKACTIELGSGACPLPSLALAAFCQPKTSYITDGSTDVVSMAFENVCQNSNVIGGQQPICRGLTWGRSDEINEIINEMGHGFDWVVGADVVYSIEAVPLFFKTARALLCGNPTGRLLLCYIVRGVCESDIQNAAGAHAFISVPLNEDLMVAKECAGITEEGAVQLCIYRLQE